MAGSNGTAPAPELHADPTGVFGRVGRTLPLGNQQITIRMLVNREVKAQKPLIDALSYSDIDGSPGEQFFSGAMSTDNWEPLAAWLSAWCDQPVTVEMLDEAMADEVIALIDAIYEQSGMAWMKRIMGNVAAAARLRQVQLLPENLPSGTERGSIPSTISFSTPQDRQPIPDQTSPSTD